MKFKLLRYIKISKRRESNGRKSICIEIPNGKTLWSNIELINYCEKNKIKLDRNQLTLIDVVTIMVSQ